MALVAEAVNLQQFLDYRCPRKCTLEVELCAIESVHAKDVLYQVNC